MLTDLLSVFLIALFVARGISRPYVALAGVIWIDLYQPQSLSQSFLAGKPLSLLMTAFFAVSLTLNARKVYRPASWLYIVIVPVFMRQRTRGRLTSVCFEASFVAAPKCKWLA